jgi:hypothetical protein
LSRTKVRPFHPEEVSDDCEVSKAVKQEMLKLIMREREEIAERLVKLDYWIWVLEEFFRAEGP